MDPPQTAPTLTSTMTHIFFKLSLKQKAGSNINICKTKCLAKSTASIQRSLTHCVWLSNQDNRSLVTHKMTNSLIWLQDLIFYDYQLGHWDILPLSCSFIITLCLFGEEKELLKDLGTHSVCKWFNVHEKNPISVLSLRHKVYFVLALSQHDIGTLRYRD